MAKQQEEGFERVLNGPLLLEEVDDFIGYFHYDGCFRNCYNKKALQKKITNEIMFDLYSRVLDECLGKVLIPMINTSPLYPSDYGEAVVKYYEMLLNLDKEEFEKEVEQFELPSSWKHFRKFIDNLEEFEVESVEGGREEMMKPFDWIISILQENEIEYECCKIHTIEKKSDFFQKIADETSEMMTSLSSKSLTIAMEFRKNDILQNYNLYRNMFHYSSNIFLRANRPSYGMVFDRNHMILFEGYTNYCCPIIFNFRDKVERCQAFVWSWMTLMYSKKGGGRKYDHYWQIASSRIENEQPKSIIPKEPPLIIKSKKHIIHNSNKSIEEKKKNKSDHKLRLKQRSEKILSDLASSL